ncbi:phage major capsid protein [Salmonella enterica]|uniref:Phage major capsid protein n=3 Tax=Salmonella TaxID=590 RepID=A0A3U4W9B0_SALET|nr:MULTISPECIES: phage major capsid protein [Salmonella]EDH8075466.1 phage major capsid protein [Salmonella enterica subsp. enterica serovar Saintpaul]EDR7495903.1 phage major capsid protein [Salmonella enterica subsp. enterica serovar Kiambu]EDU3946570.1 phage major capsid protein [Salmonella enterica subsp. enterica serovar 4,[5],12:b:-]EDX2778711.1 phage major capsid protein [Salmonella enterica subsp. enterica serovar 4,12:nonmotile]MCL9520862.1 phage major capsid protein [Salmonella enter
MELNQLQQMRAINLTQISNAIDEVDRTVELSFASEIPVTREIEGQLYNEILLCNPENVLLNRLNDGAPVLIEHDASRQVGIVENARVDMDKVCRATVRFSALGSANTIFGMILEGIRPKVSVGYNIREYYFEGNDLIVTRWEPYEISSVSTPADNSVGIGRSLNSNDEITLKDETQIMDENLNQEVITEEVEVQEEVQEVITEEKAVVAEDIQEVEVQIEVEAERSIDISSIVDAVKESLNKDVEDKRVRELQSISAVLGIDTNEAIKNNVSVEEFKRSLNKENQPIDKEIKMEQKNVIAEGLRSLKGEANELATLDRGSRGYSVDMNAMVRSTSDTVSTVTAAGLVKEQLADSYIRELLARTVLGQLPVTVFGGLDGLGNFSIPRAKGMNPVARFYAEDEAVVDGFENFDKITLKPTMFAAGMKITKQMLLSNAATERYVTDELLRHCSNGLEQAVFAKIALEVPVQTTAAAGVVDVADIQAAIQKLGVANVDVNRCVAIVHPAMLAKLRQTAVLGNTAAVSMVAGHRYDMWLNDEVRVIESTFVAQDSIVIGDFSELIFANWNSGQELDFDDTTYRAAQTIAIRSYQYLDTAIAHPEAFVQIKLQA